jgi:hypothetical protein
MTLPQGVAAAHVGLYQNTGDGWEFEGARVDSVARTVSADSRQVGRFALFTDTRAPEIKLVHPPKHRHKGSAYSTWALEAKLTDLGSGVDARASRLVVDNQPRAAEWDAEQGKLRWRPLTPPAKGKHSYKVIATDRAGNQSVRAGSFVLN